MAGIKTIPFDVARYLDSEEMIEAYLNHMAKKKDSKAMSDALGHVARARGMSKVARKAKLSRESLYSTLSTTGRPSFDTVVKVLDALGIDLQFNMRTLVRAA
ncbi:transcriptional regulator [Alphaproteobacteria bacterium]|nr:transcriptional regulator [Alphaproteobacteria bacterium]